MRNEFAQPEGAEPAAEAEQSRREPEPEVGRVPRAAAGRGPRSRPRRARSRRRAAARPSRATTRTRGSTTSRDEVPADEALAAPRRRRGEEDVLEETPDFLQETPEHDRLWFEQKPPRDFDWDK